MHQRALSRVKRQPPQNKVFSNLKSDKRLISRYIRHSCSSVTKKKQPSSKVGEGFEDISPKNTNSNIHMKSHSTSLVIRELEIRTTMRYHFISIIKIHPIKNKTTKKKCWQGMWRNENPCALLE